MHGLRERLQELADAATRDGATPGPAHALRRGRQRRRRIAGGVASLLVMTLAAGALATGRLADRPTLPPTAPATTVPLPAGPEVSRDLPGGRTTEDMAFEDLSAELRRCPDRAAGKAELIGYVRSREWRRVWMVAARPPAPGASGLCWTSGLFSGGGAGSFSGVSSTTTSAAIPLTASGSHGGDFATIEGQVTKRAVRVRVGFRDGRPPLDLRVIQAGHRYPVNFYYGIFAGSGSREREWPPAEVAAFDAEGRQVAACTIGPPWNPASACPAD